MEQGNEDSGRRGGINPQVLLMGGAAALFVVLLALVVAMVMIFSLNDDVASLQDNVRKSAKATKALQEEIATLKESAAALAAARRPAEPRPQNIDAADTGADCVIRPGSKNGLADCMKLGPR